MKKLPYFSYFEQKVKKISFYRDDQKKRKNGSTYEEWNGYEKICFSMVSRMVYVYGMNDQWKRFQISFKSQLLSGKSENL